MEPFAILQVEMYDAILSKLEDPLDKLNLVRVHPHLEDAFWHRIPEWQLASVLPIVLRYLHGPIGRGLPEYYYVDGPENVDNSDANAAAEQNLDHNAEQDIEDDRGAQAQQDPDYFDEEFNEELAENEEFDGDEELDGDEEEVMPPLPPLIRKDNLELFRGLRNCRQVSKLCCKVMDCYIEEYWEKFRHNRGPPAVTRCRWNTRRKLVQFLNESEGYRTFRNPGLSYIDGACQIGYGDEDPVGSERQMVDLFTRFGGHTRSIQLDVFLEGLTPLRVSNFLKDSLFATTNLRSLSIVFYLDLNPQLPDPENEEAPAPDILMLPDLPHLEHISLWDVNDTVCCIPPCVNLKKYFVQLKELYLEFKMWRADYNRWSTGQIQFPVLEEFHLRSFNIFEDQEKLIAILFNLNAPNMKGMQLQGTCSAKEEKYDSGVYLIQQMALCALNQRAKGDPYRAIVRQGGYGGRKYCFFYFTDDSREMRISL